MIQVIFVSESILKGKKRVNSVLDRYAKRIGSETWTTPITQEGLDVVKNTLNSIATKQTNVSCFKKTPLGNKLLFSIGRPVTRENEAISVHRHHKKKKFNVPNHIKHATILNRLAGLFHDLGKVSNEFQKKISLTEEQKKKDRSALSDSVRHELISFHLFNHFEKDHQIDFKHAWAKTQDNLNTHNNDTFINSNMSSWQDLVRFIILTHHKLPANATKDQKGFFLKKKNSLFPYFKNKELPKTKISISYDSYSEEQISNILKEIRFILQRLSQKEEQKSTSYWFALSYLCRSHFILADHEQSSIALEYAKEVPKKGDSLYANTHINNKNERVYFNQPLDWHLKHVSERASQLLFETEVMKLKGLNKETTSSILSHTEHPRFVWQNIAMDYMMSLEENTQALVLNIAGTGRGKTRSNVSILASLNNNRSDLKPLRFSTLLNLKNLTLQTTDAYKEQLKIPKNEIIGVIGDLNTMALHNHSKTHNEIALQTFLDSDEIDEDEDSFDEVDIVSFDEIDTPKFLDTILEKTIVKENKTIILKKQNKNSQVLAAPVLVSTIDFMINAGDITRQKKHSLPFLRLMNSDLILDEIDSYDPNALVAVSRIVMLSAMLGNNIVASSATLSESCAELIFNAYKKGIKLRESLLNIETKSEVIIVDDRVSPQKINCHSSNNEFNDFYSQHLIEYFSKNEPAKKIGKVLEFDKTEHGLLNAIENQIIDFHSDFKHEFLEKQISFGLIRIANINQAVHVAKFISQNDALKCKVKVCCYHSQLTTLHRHYIEENLDLILKRGKDKDNYTQMPSFINAVNSSKEEDVIFIVVATSVEEIGRDHDFDWCICEPSSTQSLVQTAGRVNRHREANISKPNFAILEYNFRALRGDDKVFCRPGLDQNITIEQSTPATPAKGFAPKKRLSAVLSSYTYKSYSAKILNITDVSMKKLLNEEEIGKRIDASLKFSKKDGKETHVFSMLDNIFLKEQLKNAFSIFNEDSYNYHFFNQDFYKYYTLRDKKGVDVFLDIGRSKTTLYYKHNSTNVNITVDPPIDNAFLDINSIDKAKRKQIIKDYDYPANSIKLSLYKADSIISEVEACHYHPNFGLYRPIKQ